MIKSRGITSKQIIADISKEEEDKNEQDTAVSKHGKNNTAIVSHTLAALTLTGNQQAEARVKNQYKDGKREPAMDKQVIDNKCHQQVKHNNTPHEHNTLKSSTRAPAIYSTVIGPTSYKMVESDTRIGWYNLGETLGEGANGHVRLGKHRFTRRRYAIKVLDKKICSSFVALKMLENEISILQKVKHPNIIGYKCTIHARQHVYVVMSLGGQNLWDYTEGMGVSIPTKVIKTLMIGTLTGLQYMHKRRLVHLDLKPENIVVNPNVKPCELTSKDVKLIDFGHAMQTNFVHGFGGTRYFFAPEVTASSRRGFNGRAADMFSFGATFGDLTGIKPPGWKQLYRENWNVKKRCIQDSAKFCREMATTVQAFQRWSICVNDDLAMLIAVLLSVNPRDRLSANEALNHNFFLE